MDMKQAFGMVELVFSSPPKAAILRNPVYIQMPTESVSAMFTSELMFPKVLVSTVAMPLPTPITKGSMMRPMVMPLMMPMSSMFMNPGMEPTATMATRHP